MDIEALRKEMRAEMADLERSLRAEIARLEEVIKAPAPAPAPAPAKEEKVTAYTIFCKEMGAEYEAKWKTESPNIKPADIRRRLAVFWTEMSLEEKKPWKDKKRAHTKAKYAALAAAAKTK
jgi:hypothetical protein